MGAAIVKKLVTNGARVAVVDRHRDWDEQLEQLEREGKVVFYALDVTDPQAVEDVFARAVAELGHLDILVNNAGISVPGALETLPMETWDKVMDVNLKGVFTCSQKAFPYLKEKGGVILNISSMSGVEPYAGMGSYCVSKAGVIMLTRQMAYEWAPYGIRVNAICPGLTRTPLTENLYQDPEICAARTALVPLKRIGVPEDMANMAVFLASDEASYVTGQAIVVDGGLLGTAQMHIRGRSATR